MTLVEFTRVAKILKTAYPQQNFLPNEESVKIWHRLLEDLDAEEVKNAALRYISTEHFAPSIADIRGLATARRGIQTDWGVAWQEVMRAVRRYGVYRASEALDSLDPLTQATVKAIGFTDICRSENVDIQRAQFKNLYERRVTEINREISLPAGLRDNLLLEQATERLKLTFDEG